MLMGNSSILADIFYLLVILMILNVTQAVQAVFFDGFTFAMLCIVTVWSLL